MIPKFALFALSFLASATALGAQQRDTPFRVEPQIVIAPPLGAQSPYVGFETREVKTLSTERQEGLKRGAGMGYALAAELNGFPGPMHVLELAEQLGLDADQKSRVQKAFEKMCREAISAGEALLAAEAHLDRIFTLKQATYDRIEAQTAVAAGQEARLRAIHLKAHLEMAEILTPEQIESYNRLRGFVDQPSAPGPIAPAQQHQGPLHRPPAR
jgi:Spy/CpxP family protein refolding chaperone